MPTGHGVHHGDLVSCLTPAHCGRQSWHIADPTSALQNALKG